MTLNTRDFDNNYEAALQFAITQSLHKILNHLKLIFIFLKNSLFWAGLPSKADEMRRFQLEESRVEKPTGRTLPPRVWRTLGCWGGNRRRTPSRSWGLQPPKAAASRRSTPQPALQHLRAGSTVMSFQAPRNLSVGMTRMKSPPPPLRLMTLSLTSLTGQVVSQGRSQGQLTLRPPVPLPSRHVHQVNLFFSLKIKWQ